MKSFLSGSFFLIKTVLRDSNGCWSIFFFFFGSEVDTDGIFT